jgi:nucleoside-diphosphate-sugar epimerase
MGGMGFIQSNHSVILYNNTMISYNMLEAARQNGVSRCDWRCCSAAAPTLNTKAAIAQPTYPTS